MRINKDFWTRVFLAIFLIMVFVIPSIAAAWDIMPTDGPGIQPGEENNPVVKLANSEDLTVLANTVDRITPEDVAKYNKILADRGIKLGELVGKANVEGLLPDYIKKCYFDRGWNFKVRESESFLPPRRFLAATKLYGKTSKLTSEKKLEGFLGGYPFPKPTQITNPDTGYQILWNNFMRAFGDNWFEPALIYWINGKKGLTRSSQCFGMHRAMQNRLFSGIIVPDKDQPPNLRHVMITFMQEPFDVRGMWIKVNRVNDGTFDEVWAYVPSARRVRRLSASANKDVYAGTDLINDDTSYGYGGQIPWIPKATYMGDTVVFGHAHGEKPAATQKKENPYNYDPNYFDINNAPYFLQQNDTYELRPAFIVETAWNKDYPYSKSVFYIDKETYYPIYRSMYDQKGELWKINISGTCSYSKNNSPFYQSVFDGTCKEKSINAKVFQEGYIHGSFQIVHDVQSDNASTFQVSASVPYSGFVHTEDLTLAALQQRSR